MTDLSEFIELHQQNNNQMSSHRPLVLLRYSQPI